MPPGSTAPLQLPSRDRVALGFIGVTAGHTYDGMAQNLFHLADGDAVAGKRSIKVSHGSAEQAGFGIRDAAFVLGL